ncbi:AI-2E family transporter [Microbacterium sp. 179-B 1A2 NHS]|uniref:AI-2E family transporter n=1 Tax=Microbacterium sp. 179-B 1A2 NHS TaxID=3142383 RepID=UPI0039A0EE0E
MTGALLALALGIAVTRLSTVWIYISIALFVALGLDPLVRRLSARFPRPAAIAIVYAAFALVVAGVVWLVVPTVVEQIAQFVRSLPQLIAALQETDVYARLSAQFGDQVSEFVSELQTFLTDPASLAAVGGGVLQLGISVFSGISGTIIVIVLSLYFLASLRQMKESFYRLSPARSRDDVARITEEITRSVGGYLSGMVVLAVLNSLFALVVFALAGQPFAILLAVTAFSLTIIPLVGTVLFWFVGSAAALLHDPTSAVVFAIAYLIYMQVEAYVLTPRVMNRAVSVPGSLVVIGALIGGTLLGLLGALVAVPVTASILLIVKEVVIPRQNAKSEHPQTDPLPERSGASRRYS